MMQWAAVVQRDLATPPTSAAALALEARAQAVMNQHAKSFAWAARWLSANAKPQAAVLYAFARAADDLADEPALGPLPQRMALLSQLSAVALAHRDEALSGLDVTAAVTALPDSNARLAASVGQQLRQHGVSRDVLSYFLQSLQADSGARELQTTQELLGFAWGVAGTVGQMMRPVLGAPVQADHYAMALGVAMQLTNIARDVVEDAQRGRCYLPADWHPLGHWSLGSLVAPASTDARHQIFSAIERLLQLAEEFYVYAWPGIGQMAVGNQRAIRLAWGLYRGIGQKILRQGAHHYWRGRCHLSVGEKIVLVLGMAWSRRTHGHTVTTATADVGQTPVPRNVVAQDMAHLHEIPGFPPSPAARAQAAPAAARPSVGAG